MELSIYNKSGLKNFVTVATASLLVTSTLISGTVHAGDRCRVVSVTETESVAEIQQYDSLNRSVNHTQNGTQCSVSFNALIAGKYYPAIATVEKDADPQFVCEQAFQQAAQDVRRRAAGERITKKEHMVCDGDGNNGYKPRRDYEQTWNYKGFTCKHFVQKVQQGGKLYTINKPACEVGPGQWVGIENW
jgi:hypothetical protein